MSVVTEGMATGRAVETPLVSFDERVESTRFPSTESRWTFRLTLAATFLTWPLLLVGGMVTTYRVGMAVPDWPTTFGVNMFLYDFINASWGVFAEHGHRLLGAAIGLVVLCLCIYLLVADRRVWMKGLGLLALVGVISQGILGGLRVNLNSTSLAMVHGITGQLFFSFLVVMCVLSSRSWSQRRMPESATRASEGSVRIASLAWLMIPAWLAVETQIGLGAWLRHFGSASALAMHAGFSLVVTTLSLSAIVLAHRSGRALVKHPSRWLGLALGIQVSLGIASWLVLRPFDGILRRVDTVDAAIRTLHQANGALLLAATTVLAMQAWRSKVQTHDSQSDSAMLRFDGLEPNRDRLRARELTSV